MGYIRRALREEFFELVADAAPYAAIAAGTVLLAAVAKRAFLRQLAVDRRKEAAKEADGREREESEAAEDTDDKALLADLGGDDGDDGDEGDDSDDAPPPRPLASRPRTLYERSSELLRDSRPRRIILIRHGESEGNVDRNVYAYKPDHALKLTEAGHRQALEAGKKLREIIGDGTLHFIVSPYERCKLTLQGIVESFKDVAWTYCEEPRIREQEWGMFQDPEKMPTMMSERRRMGSFFYRFEGGESGADVYDRLSSYIETMHRDFARHPGRDAVVIVCHGLLARLFLMRWFHWEVRHFHSLWNLDNCGMVVLEKQQLHKNYKIVTPMACNVDNMPPSKNFTESAYQRTVVAAHRDERERAERAARNKAEIAAAAAVAAAAASVEGSESKA